MGRGTLERMLERRQIHESIRSAKIGRVARVEKLVLLLLAYNAVHGVELSCGYRHVRRNEQRVLAVVLLVRTA